MYFIAIALTCIAFAAYVLFAVAYRSGSTSKITTKPKVGKPNKRKAVTKAKPVVAQPVSKKAQAKAAVKPKAKKELKVEEEEELVPIVLTNKPQAEQKKVPAKQAAAPKKKKETKPLPEGKKPKSTDSLSDFEKLEGDEEIIEEGWEVIVRRKPKAESEQPTGEDAEKSESAAEETEKPKTGEKRKERGEGRNRDRSDRPFDADRKNRGERKGGDKRPFLPQTAASQQPEKKKKTPQPPRDVRVGGYIFSRLPPSAKPGQPTPFETLSETIDQQACASDDCHPLKTAHLELRFYREAPQPPKAKPGAVWEAMAKYNYTNKPANSEEEDKEEGEEESESGPSEMPFAKEEELVDSFLRSLGGNFSKSLTKAHMEKGKPQRFLSPSDLAAAKQDLVKLMVEGTSQEPPVFNDAAKASEFLEKVLNNFDQSSVRCFSTMGARLWTRGFHDEGFFFFDQHRIGLFWFLGYD